MTAPFLDYCARRWAGPADALADFFQDAQLAAAEVGAKLDALPLLDGERHYLPGLEGGDSQKHYYRAHIEQDKDGTAWPCVTFGSFKAGEPKRYWKPRDLAWSDFQGAGQSSGSSSEQRSRYAEKVAQAAAEAATRKATNEECRKQGREAAAAAAAQAWSAAAASKPHPYLSAKGVENYGLKVATADLVARLWSAEDGEWKDGVTVVRRGELLLPMKDAEGRLWNLQRIDAKGRKRFIMGGRVKGTFCRIEGEGEAWLVEGYATGATVRAATGAAVVVAFSAGNLAPVSRALAGQLRGVAADNDPQGAGEKGAQETGLPMAMPPAVGTDWNDHAAEHGLEAVAEALAQQAGNVASSPAPSFVDFPDLSAKNRPLNTIENLEALMQAHQVRARYNLVSKTVELDVPGLGGTADNRANTSLAVLASIAARHSMPRESLGEYVKAIADRNAFSPVGEWIRAKQWDGRDRLPAFFATIEAEDKALRDVLLRRWLIAAVAAVMKPSGFWCKGVLTLQGAQNLGKTSWFRALVPQELRHLIREGMHLDAQNRDCIVTAVSHWLVELGELEATLRRDMESLKAFITQTSDRMRRPYDRVDSEYPRRTVFFASVNSDRFLKDATGNSRFWVLRCQRIEHAHGLDMQQVWAQVYAQFYLQGEQWHLTQEEQEQLDRANGQFREISPIEELLPLRFDLNVKPTTELTATQVLLHLGYDKPTRAQQLEAGAALKNLNVPHRLLRGNTVYKLPLPKIGQGF